MNKILDFLKGKKTYIVAAVMAIATFANVMGWIDNATLLKVQTFLAGIGLAALRNGITNSGS